MFKRSTRSIVAGKRKAAPIEDADPANKAGSAPEYLSAEANQQSAESGSAAALSKLQTFFAEHQLNIILVAIAAVISLLVGILIGAAFPRKNNTTEATKETVVIPGDQSIVSIYVGEALAAAAEPGDIVQLYNSKNQPVIALSYVQVYSTSENKLLLLVDAKQTDSFIEETLGSKVVLVAHSDPDRAAQLLDLQKRINNPEISLTLQNALTIFAGESAELNFSASILPEQAIMPEIIWESSDPAVLSVTQDGTVTAHSAGSATVTVTCGAVQATCAVKINAPLESVALDATSAQLAISDTLTLTMIPSPADAVYDAPVWSSSDPAIATVSQNGVVTPVAPGKVTITVTAGAFSAKCTVTIGYHAEAVQLDQSALSLTVGEKYKLTALIYPNTDILDSSSFSSSNPDVVTVGADGTVTAISAGKATITFQCGKASTTCTVTVKTVPEPTPAPTEPTPPAE